MDLEQRKVLYWKETGYSPGEPVFVARPGGSGEDDGESLDVDEDFLEMLVLIRTSWKRWCW